MIFFGHIKQVLRGIFRTIYTVIFVNVCLSVWQTLDDQNQDFFKAYYPSLILKEQIIRFNNLVIQQAAIMNQLKHRHEIVVPNLQSQILPSKLNSFHY